MEIDLLASRIQQSLQKQTNYDNVIPKLPPCLQDNTQEEIETALLLALRGQVEQRGITYLDITNSEMADKLRSAAWWLKAPQYRSCLLLQGSNGNGKSSLLMAIYRLLNSVDGSIIQTSSERLFTFYRQNLEGQSSVYTECKMAKRLCIDELGAEPVRCQVYGVDYTPIQSLLSYRYDKQLPTIITTNLSDEMIRERYGERISDRFAEMCTILRFRANSYRK